VPVARPPAPGAILYRSLARCQAMLDARRLKPRQRRAKPAYAGWGASLRDGGCWSPPIVS